MGLSMEINCIKSPSNMDFRHRTLDVLTCPLSSVNLIEASAGTGKTWTIAALFVRLLLEERGGEPPPTVDKVLVVTYTKAATAELRERLRRRLSECAKILSGTGEPTDDPFLRFLAVRFPSGAFRDRALKRLNVAITSFDAAAIYTMHGFCHRVLTEAAFESNQAFSTELISENEDRLIEIVDDFWRSKIADNPLLAQVLVQRGESPSGWLLDIRPYLCKPYLRMRAVRVADLKMAGGSVDRAWRALTAHSESLLDAAGLLRATSGFNARSYSSTIIERSIGALASLLATPDIIPVLTKEHRLDLGKLLPGALTKGMKKGCPVPRHTLFALLETWLSAWDDYLDAVELWVAQLKLDLIVWVNQQLSAHRAGKSRRSFDELLTDLGGALADPITGPSLATHVVRTFQMVLVDEFQDTDPIQYSIFRHCFVAQQRTVFLVGDPKQAIYSFRGADIFAYLSARGDAQHHYTLDTNHRSVAPLVSLVNVLFGRTRPFLIEDIAYQSIAAQPSSSERLDIDDDRATFCFQWLEIATTGNAASREAVAQLATDTSADEIVRLLVLADDGRAAIVSGATRRSLAGSDIAVLVFTHRQGDLIRQALLDRGVASVALTQESVFASREAGEILALLRAWADPGREALLRVALATELAGFDASELLEVVESETRWGEHLKANAEYHLLWRGRGFIAAWRNFLVRERVAERLLPLPDGERRLTNLTHLAELLQQEADQHIGMAHLLDWLECRVAQPPSGEEAVLRLESDSALVKIVTIHAAKGLQYPVVFCPFLWWGSLERDSGGFCRYYADGQSWLAHDSAVGGEVKVAARGELFSETLRLLYVALTRAQYRQYVCWGRVRGIETAALSWLLNRNEVHTLPELESLKQNAVVLRLVLDRFVAEANVTFHGSCVVLEEREPVLPLAVRSHAQSDYRALRFTRRLAPSWRMASFSSLTHAQMLCKSEEHSGYVVFQAAGQVGPPALPGRDRFGFPQGARAGICLHEILENISFGIDPAGLRQAVQRGLARHRFDPEWTDAGYEMLSATLSVELDPGVKLANVSDDKRLIEMEFMLPTPQLEVAKLAAILSKPEHGLAAPFRAAASKLEFFTVRGFLKGRMDLVCEVDGRIYLVDYKSNYLGGQHEDYRVERLSESIAKEHYYLQYLIYCVALRRYFYARGVDFSARFFGVRYLYLRGVGSDGYGLWTDLPNPALLTELDAWCAGYA